MRDQDFKASAGITSYLLHPNPPFTDNVLQPLYADGVQGQVERQLCLRQNDGQGARVLIPLQLAVKDERHNDDALFSQDKKLDIHSAAFCTSQNLPVECVISQKRDLSVTEDHQLVALWCPDVTHTWAQDVIPVCEGGGQQRAFPLYGHLRLCHGR